MLLAGMGLAAASSAVFLLDDVPALFVGRMLSGLSAGVAISIPVIGVGGGTAALGLVPAAATFTGLAAAPALGAFVSLLRRR